MFYNGRKHIWLHLRDIVQFQLKTSSWCTAIYFIFRKFARKRTFKRFVFLDLISVNLFISFIYNLFCFCALFTIKLILLVYHNLRMLVEIEKFWWTLFSFSFRIDFNNWMNKFCRIGKLVINRSQLAYKLLYLASWLCYKL